jgi:hypothetical protein
MGGGNAQKSAAARMKNMKDKGKTPEERKVASAKAAADAAAFVCASCRSTFMVNVKPPTLHLHCTTKHPGVPPVDCFSQLADFDPEDPTGAKKIAATAKAVPIKKKKPKADDMDDLLSAGLKKTTKKK